MINEKREIFIPRTKGKTARKNKQRSRAMEQEIAEFLNGQRVPMSGSGAIKGDVNIPFDAYRTIYGECKLTEGEILNVPQYWLRKIQEESQEMRCVFGVLLVKFMFGRKNTRYVLFPDTALRYFPDTEYTHVDSVITQRLKIYRNGIARDYTTKEHGRWILVTLERFKEMLEEYRIGSVALQEGP